MTRTMAALASLLAACPIQAPAQERMPNGTHAIQRFQGKTLPPASQHTIAIEPGVITTFDGCNVISGRMALSGKAITWTAPMSVTTADCPDVEVKIGYEALMRASSWDVRGGTLLILDAAGETIIAANAK